MTTLTKQIDKALIEMLDKYSRIEMKIIERINQYVKDGATDGEKIELRSLGLMCSEFNKMIHDEYDEFKAYGGSSGVKKREWERIKKTYKAGYNVLLDEIIRLKKLGIEI